MRKCPKCEAEMRASSVLLQQELLRPMAYVHQRSDTIAKVPVWKCTRTGCRFFMRRGN